MTAANLATVRPRTKRPRGPASPNAGLHRRGDRNRSTLRRKDGTRRDRALLDLPRFAGLASGVASSCCARSVSAADLTACGKAVFAVSSSGPLSFADWIACGEPASSVHSGSLPSGTPAMADVPVPQKGWFAPPDRFSRRISPAARRRRRFGRAAPLWWRPPRRHSGRWRCEGRTRISCP